MAPRPTTAWLIAYNYICAILWVTVLGRTVLVAMFKSPSLVPISVSTWVRWTQAVAILEILHSTLGIVKAPVFTTLIQVASRLLLVWGIVYPFPHLSNSPWYTSMLLAWSLTEIIRYSYFALLRSGHEYKWLTWLRYSTFTVLYPIGITSECVMIWHAIEPFREIHPLAPLVLYSILALYVPGSIILFTYMMKQRKKVLGNEVTVTRKTH